ncbi:hypothetical protein [Angelakisella massiliensis]|uniref:hypothetical protein n=1 Tax=Angelakisella massiliensis TaxID=1871018 RepID=UPI0024B1B691|nr:hypothetical protein [Angelakisella massiliensis]
MKPTFWLLYHDFSPWSNAFEMNGQKLLKVKIPVKKTLKCRKREKLLQFFVTITGFFLIFAFFSGMMIGNN